MSAPAHLANEAALAQFMAAAGYPQRPDTITKLFGWVKDNPDAAEIKRLQGFADYDCNWAMSTALLVYGCALEESPNAGSPVAFDHGVKRLTTEQLLDMLGDAP